MALTRRMLCGLPLIGFLFEFAPAQGDESGLAPREEVGANRDLAKEIADLTDRIRALEAGRQIQEESISWLSRTSPPVGTVVAFIGPWEPTDSKGKKWSEIELGWLLCDGRDMQPEGKAGYEIYDELVKVLGKTKLPDLRGCFLRGIDASIDGTTTSGRDKDGVRPVGAEQDWATGLPKAQFNADLAGAFDPTNGDNRAQLVVVDGGGDTVHEKTDATDGEINIRHGIPVGQHPGHTHTTAIPGRT